jgi:hypothetical protein
MAGHSRLKDGVASLAYDPAIHVFLADVKNVDGRVKPTAVRFNFGGHGAWH